VGGAGVHEPLIDWVRVRVDRLLRILWIDTEIDSLNVNFYIINYCAYPNREAHLFSQRVVKGIIYTSTQFFYQSKFLLQYI
jgi:hypothetical protein